MNRIWTYLAAAYIDLRLLATGKAERDLPPLRLRFVGAGDFRAVGKHLLDLTLSRGRITTHSRILDIGCGVGRLALPLTEYLRHGQYEGFDVVWRAIRWCKQHISRTHQNFHFQYVALRNPEYSSRGRSAAEFTFPYQDDTFDCAVAFSVFTHLALNEITNYIREAQRVLVPGGRLVFSCFLLNQESEAALPSLPEMYRFPYRDGPVCFTDATNRGLAVAIEEATLRCILHDVGFRDCVVEYGGWYGREPNPSFQDLVTCVK
ncbi:MAG TPA: methyltransferase domain-containing protein [Thermoanaerobaculia bacterium]|nr:methyltransferase domain-containing protein [Thermoanaerobaculia bacterium]